MIKKKVRKAIEDAVNFFTSIHRSLKIDQTPIDRLYHSKGQLISECLFDNLKFSKNNEKFERCLPYNIKSGQINKIKATSYNI